MKRTPFLAAPALALTVASLALAHPHLRKTITVKLPAGGDVTISYVTEPSNESHTAKAAAGSFIHAGARITLSTEVKAGAVTLSIGEYTIGAIKNADNDYTMALYPGSVRLSDTPDMAKLIKLEWLRAGAGDVQSGVGLPSLSATERDYGAPTLGRVAVRFAEIDVFHGDGA